MEVSIRRSVISRKPWIKTNLSKHTLWTLLKIPGVFEQEMSESAAGVGSDVDDDSGVASDLAL
jgi:hypothetical protein